MKKSKLIDARKKRGLSQKEIADVLCVDVSNYNRREKGQIKITNQEWEILSDILSIPVEEIYEANESNFLVFKDSSNHIYSIPEYMLKSQRNYIQRLEEENQHLKKKIGQLKETKVLDN